MCKKRRKIIYLILGISTFNVRAKSCIKSICDRGYGIPPSLSHLTICVRSGSPATRTSLSDSERHRIIKINDKTEESTNVRILYKQNQIFLLKVSMIFIFSLLNRKMSEFDTIMINKKYITIYVLLISFRL